MDSCFVSDSHISILVKFCMCERNLNFHGYKHEADYNVYYVLFKHGIFVFRG